MGRGSTFVILTKAKGWYIVQKDPDGLGNTITDQTKCGWVPAGMSMLHLPSTKPLCVLNE
jgi:hypothetical protein